MPKLIERLSFPALSSSAFSLLMEAGRSLLARDALLSLPVLVSHYSPNRADRVTVVGIVVVQGSTIPGVDDPDIVGVPGVRRECRDGYGCLIAISLF